MTMSLWCCLEAGKRRIEEDVGWRGQAPTDEGEQTGNRKERVREAGYPLLQDLMAKNRILIDLCVVMH